MARIELKTEKAKPLRLYIQYVKTRKGYRLSLRRIGEYPVLAAWFITLDQARTVFQEALQERKQKK
jgi:hypothetical protein